MRFRCTKRERHFIEHLAKLQKKGDVSKWIRARLLHAPRFGVDTKRKRVGNR